MTWRVVVLVLVALVAACGPSGTRFAVDDDVVREPVAVLAAADAAFEAWLAETLASRDDDARCYFDARPHQGRDGDLVTEAVAWCGPVLTLEHDERYPWAQIELASRSDSGGRLLLEPSTSIRAATREPGQLVRADGQVLAEHHSALAYPEPPPLGETHSERVEEALELRGEGGPVAETFVLHGGDARIAELEVSSIVAEQLGTGRTRRVAPDGHELLLFEVEQRGGPQLGRILSRLDVGSAERELDVSSPLDDGQVLVVVPTGEELTLHVRQDDVDQRLDLRTGEIERDPRAENARRVGIRRASLGLEVDATWTQTHTFEGYGADYTYDGRTYFVEAWCDETVVSPFDGGWAPADTKAVDVECTDLSVDFLADLTDEAVEASGRLRVGSETLEPVDVEMHQSSSWSGGWSVNYRFHVPVHASTATFVFTGHAEIDDDGRRLQRYAPAASATIDLES
jgi:hypothetical protein